MAQILPQKLASGSDPAPRSDTLSLKSLYDPRMSSGYILELSGLLGNWDSVNNSRDFLKELPNLRAKTSRNRLRINTQSPSNRSKPHLADLIHLRLKLTRSSS